MKRLPSVLTAALIAGLASPAAAQDDPDQSFHPGPPPEGPLAPTPASPAGQTPSTQAPPTQAPQPPAESLLVDTWNTAACGFTDTSVFDLAAPARITRVAVWYNWSAGEREVHYAVFTQGRRLGVGTMVRGSCDPYQGAWCEARADVGAVFPAGGIQVRLDRGAVCQNPGSRGSGFIRVWGVPGG